MVGLSIVVVGAAAAIGVKYFSFVPRAALGLMDCFLGEVCSRLVAVGALVASMDILLLFLLVAESLVSFVFGSGDGNKCIDALGGPLILLVEVYIILLLAFGNAIAKELKADQACLGL